MKTRTIHIPKGYKISDAITDLRKLCDVWVFSEKNIDETTSDRDSTEAYSISFQDTQEADKEMKYLPANVLKEKNIKGITLLERLVMEIDYFKETGEHLDPATITLCSGSRYLGGYVPGVYWYSDRSRVIVFYHDPADSFVNLRTRVGVYKLKE